MRTSRDIMGMPASVEIVGGDVTAIEAIFDYFTEVDARFSTYKPESEIMKINRGEIPPSDYSDAMKEIFARAEETKRETHGYFSIQKPDGSFDPSGLVKGWAIQNAAERVMNMGYENLFIDVGGDIQSHGTDANGLPWTVGIRSPFNPSQIIKVLTPQGRGVATSGTYIRGSHIYNPHDPKEAFESVVSVTVLGPNIYEADRFATAAFAMGERGIHFIEKLPGFEGYSIDTAGIATMTTGFEHISAV